MKIEIKEAITLFTLYSDYKCAENAGRNWTAKEKNDRFGVFREYAYDVLKLDSVKQASDIGVIIWRNFDDIIKMRDNGETHIEIELDNVVEMEKA